MFLIFEDGPFQVPPVDVYSSLFNKQPVDAVKFNQ